MQVQVPYIVNDLPSYSSLLDALFDPQAAYVSHKVHKRVYKRTRLAEAQNWRCCWCGCKTVAEPERYNSATVEHLLPKSKGGTDHMDNLVMACKRCNNWRGNRDIYEFFEICPLQNPPKKKKAA